MLTFSIFFKNKFLRIEIKNSDFEIKMIFPPLYELFQY